MLIAYIDLLVELCHGYHIECWLLSSEVCIGEPMPVWSSSIAPYNFTIINHNQHTNFHHDNNNNNIPGHKYIDIRMMGHISGGQSVKVVVPKFTHGPTPGYMEVYVIDYDADKDDTVKLMYVNGLCLCLCLCHVNIVRVLLSGVGYGVCLEL